MLEIAAQAHRALTAYDILERLAAQGLGAQPPVAYRASTSWSATASSHRIERLDAFVACTHPGEAHAPAFLICRALPARWPRRRCTARRTGLRRGGAATRASAIERTVVEAEGLCAGCREAAE